MPATAASREPQEEGDTTMLTTPRRRAVRGFSLVELLVALALGALIVTALATMVPLMGEQAEEVRRDADRELETAVALIADDVRSAWAVERPAADRLVVHDALGNQTVYELSGGALRVSRPSGDSGDLVSDVASLTFTVEETTRLRDDTPAAQYGTIASKTTGSSTPALVLLQAGDKVAMGFRVPTAAPDEFDVVDGIDEQLLHSTIDRVSVAVGFINANLKEFCHLHAAPPHNPTHPGYEGGRLYVDVYEARVPGDPRPHGPVLASTIVPATQLPPSIHRWIDTTTGEYADPPDGVEAGLYPPCIEGLPCPEGPHMHALDVPGGVAWGWWDNHPEVELFIPTPTTAADVPITGLGAVLEPGKDYSLVISVSGFDMLALGAVPATDSPVAIKKVGETTFTTQPKELAFRIEGTRTFTQTREQPVVSRVTIAATRTDGRSTSASSTVVGQVVAQVPWYGAVPGETPALQLAGN